MNYVDTSALLKWYLPEEGSDAFGVWIATQDAAHISRLVQLEVVATLARKQRNRELSTNALRLARASFEGDLANGLLRLLPMSVDVWETTQRLLDEHPELPLRTLDALHLAVATLYEVRVLATADRQLAAAARTLGFTTPEFV